MFFLRPPGDILFRKRNSPDVLRALRGENPFDGFIFIAGSGNP
jgi:hypothetical protein